MLLTNIFMTTNQMKSFLKPIVTLVCLCASLAANSASVKCLDVLLGGEKIVGIAKTGQVLNDLRFELISNLQKSNPAALNGMNITEAMAHTAMLAIGTGFASNSSIVLIRVPISHPDYFAMLNLVVIDVNIFLSHGKTAVDRLTSLREDTKDIPIKNTLAKIINTSNNVLAELGACKQ